MLRCLWIRLIYFMQICIRIEIKKSGTKLHLKRTVGDPDLDLHRSKNSGPERCTVVQLYTVPKVIDFPRYNMKCSGVNQILRGIFHGVSRFPLHFMLYRANVEYFSNSVFCPVLMG